MSKRKKFTADEIVLCIYAARFGADNLGGVDSIRLLESRSLPSIEMKIRNIVAMCDAEGITRDSTHQPLSGTSENREYRSTNLDELKVIGQLPRDELLKHCRSILSGQISRIGEGSTEYREGGIRVTTLNRYERDSAARKKCIEHYGASCVVCGFNFGEVFGSEFVGFIHVHHLVPIVEIGRQYVIDPIDDLRPVCPNCHAAIHVGGETRTIEQIQAIRNLFNDSRR